VRSNLRHELEVVAEEKERKEHEDVDQQGGHAVLNQGRHLAVVVERAAEGVE
jgi:hypothetical protein